MYMYSCMCIHMCISMSVYVYASTMLKNTGDIQARKKCVKLW